MENVALVGFSMKTVQFSPKIFAQNGAQPLTGKFANNKKNEPTTSSGMDSKNPSLTAMRYLFCPIFSAKFMKNDSILLVRQKNLWQQKIGTQVELEQRELGAQNSKASYFSALEKYSELNRQLEFSSSQSKNNLLISNKLENDFILKKF